MGPVPVKGSLWGLSPQDCPELVGRTAHMAVRGSDKTNVPLFRRSNSIRRTMAQRDADRALAESPELASDEEFDEMHKNLDEAERQLAKLREAQGGGLADSFSTPKPTKGEVHQVDLRSILDLDAVDEDFDRRFEEFATADESDERQNWLFK